MPLGHLQQTCAQQLRSPLQLPALRRAAVLLVLFFLCAPASAAAGSKARPLFITDARMGIHTYESIVQHKQRQVNIRVHLRFLCSQEHEQRSGNSAGAGGGARGSSSDTAGRVWVEGFVESHLIAAEPPAWAPNNPHFFAYQIQQLVNISISSRCAIAHLLPALVWQLRSELARKRDEVVCTRGSLADAGACTPHVRVCVCVCARACLSCLLPQGRHSPPPGVGGAARLGPVASAHAAEQPRPFHSGRGWRQHRAPAAAPAVPLQGWARSASAGGRHLERAHHHQRLSTGRRHAGLPGAAAPQAPQVGVSTAVAGLVALATAERGVNTLHNPSRAALGSAGATCGPRCADGCAVDMGGSGVRLMPSMCVNVRGGSAHGASTVTGRQATQQRA
jgi:hypothetical protein